MWILILFLQLFKRHIIFQAQSRNTTICLGKHISIGLDSEWMAIYEY